MTGLPVEVVLPEVADALAAGRNAVLVAEPGAGKTTVVPWRLLEAPWLAGRRILMLEPRRIAARAAAARLAWHLGSSVGEEAGYRVRFETKVSARTRIEVVTEGVLARLFAEDPSLGDYGLVILDEFHERSVPGDLGLALALKARSVFRPDLRVLVMSATIDAEAVARTLGGAVVVRSPGRVFPIETRYRPPRGDRRLEGEVAAVVRESLAMDDGDLLVFLPGAGEIRRVAAALAEPAPGAAVLTLHGSLAPAEQDRVLSPGRERRVILASAVAETSLTVPGVRVVIDAGLMRVSRFSPRTGMSRLETVRVTRASADQRRGRAGRTAPGVCYRLWAPGEEPGFLAHRTPELLTADLAPLALELAAAGLTPDELEWLDPPPSGPWQRACASLTLLGALSTDGRITETGRRMAALPLHPRLAHVAVAAGRGPAGATAAALVSLLGDRDPARRGPGGEAPDADIRLRLEALAGRPASGIVIDSGARARLRDEIAAWRRRLGVDRGAAIDPDLAGELLARGFPDRVAQRRGGPLGRFLLENGRGAALPPGQSLVRADYLVAVDLDDRGAEGRIDLAAPLDAAALGSLVRSAGRLEREYFWDPDRRRVRAREQLRLGAIVVEERAVPADDPARARAVALDAVRAGGIEALAWTDPAVRLRARLAFLHAQAADQWPSVSDEALLDRLDALLAGWDPTQPLDTFDAAAALQALVPPNQRHLLDRLAPERCTVPTGRQIAIDYQDPAAPVLAVRLQEMFGLERTPAVADGRVPLTLHLLSPAGRPLQVTRDLAGFWRSSYHDVRREMKGRYPKHEWPEDPAAATPTHRARRR